MYTHKIGIIAILLTFVSAQAQGVQVTTYTGTVDGQSVRVKLYPVEGLYLGEVKVCGHPKKASTFVVGWPREEEQGVELREYTQDGMVIALWQFQLREDSLIGKKYKPYTDQQKMLRLLKKRKQTGHVLKEPQDREGDYAYQFGEKGPQGLFSITSISPDRIAIDAVAVTSAPARNIASYRDTAPLVHHRFEHKFTGPTYDDVPCEIALEGKFYRNFLRVQYTNTNPCAFYFGHRATLEGIFKKNQVNP